MIRLQGEAVDSTAVDHRAKRRGLSLIKTLSLYSPKAILVVPPFGLTAEDKALLSQTAQA